MAVVRDREKSLHRRRSRGTGERHFPDANRPGTNPRGPLCWNGMGQDNVDLLFAGTAFADLSFWRKVGVSGADASSWLTA